MHSSAVSHSNGSLLNSYCVEAVCYNNSIVNTMFTPEDCSGGSCVPEQLSPTVPDVDDHPHWFFSYALFYGGSFHLLLSLLMAIFYFALNTSDFRIPDKDVLLNQLYEYVKIMFIVNLLCIYVYRFMFKKARPRNYFEKLEPPRYFEIPFHDVLFRIIYVIVRK